MSGLRWWVVVGLCTLACASSLAVENRYDLGLHDHAELLSKGWLKAIGEHAELLATNGGLALAVVIERGRTDLPQGAETPAARWLAAWQKEDEAFGGAPAVPRAVFFLRLRDARATLAYEPELASLFTAERSAEWTDKVLTPAVAAGETEGIATVVMEVLRSLAVASGATPAETVPEAAPVRETVAGEARPELSPWLWIGLPVLLFGLAGIGRWGLLPGLLAVPWIGLLYAGLYLVVRFAPQWFAWLGFTAVAPLALLLLTPRATVGTAAAAGPVPVSTGGFGLTGHGALGRGSLPR